jgi:DNA-directed RNA polymerase subunit beta
VNKLGFIETPYRKVSDGKVKGEDIIYLSAEEEDEQIIAQANAQISSKGVFESDRVKARFEGDFPVVEPKEITLMDVAPNQIASIAASLIPFLEHDDANRALMGSNMSRQAVPLMRPESPIVGTGLERLVARDSRVLIHAEGDGVIHEADANSITVKYDRSEEDELVSFDNEYKTYHLTKFTKTNQSTTMNIKPIVLKGQKVSKGDVLCEGYATQQGELALGRNLMVAFMPWKGYNFEDAIVISEKVVRDDIFTSVHVDEYVLEVRDTKRGLEELTADIPNVSEEATKNLDENGLIRIGTEVKEGDILIGKITPKGETDPTPEEKLLRAIFGDKAGDVKDASLKVPPSGSGVVINKKLFSRAIKDRKAKAQEKHILEEIDKEYEKQIADLQNRLVEKLFNIVSGKTSQGVFNNFNEEIIKKGTKFTQKSLTGLDYTNLNPSGWTTDDDKNVLIKRLLNNYNIKANDALGVMKRKKFAITVGDELPAGIIQLAKVYLANKRKLKVGDKMAGRHGNKGIVAKIVRQEDMPFLEDGTPVDIVLNPLGVPSRMNLGQIYETVLGWAGKNLGVKFSTPIFDGATMEDVDEWTKKANVPENGRAYLYDGGTGERFHQPATVGVIYMLKLHHLVDNKMHARSIGPYSLITQQPLGGKALSGQEKMKNES